MTAPNRAALDMATDRLERLRAPPPGFRYADALGDNSAISYVLDCLNYYRAKATDAEIELNRRDQRPHGIDNAF